MKIAGAIFGCLGIAAVILLVVTLIEAVTALLFAELVHLAFQQISVLQAFVLIFIALFILGGIGSALRGRHA